MDPDVSYHEINTRQIPSPFFIAAGVVLAASLLGITNLVLWFTWGGLEAALSVDGGGGSTFAILLFLSLFGLFLGWPVAAIIHAWAPRSWWAYIGGLALYSTIGGWLNSTPILTLEGWLEGAFLSLVFAAMVLGLGAALQRWRKLR